VLSQKLQQLAEPSRIVGDTGARDQRGLVIDGATSCRPADQSLPQVLVNSSSSVKRSTVIEPRTHAAPSLQRSRRDKIQTSVLVLGQGGDASTQLARVGHPPTQRYRRGRNPGEASDWSKPPTDERCTASSRSRRTATNREHTATCLLNDSPRLGSSQDGAVDGKYAEHHLQ
jgi:hypothetical protein